jgi:hypothetical protein
VTTSRKWLCISASEIIIMESCSGNSDNDVIVGAVETAVPNTVGVVTGSSSDNDDVGLAIEGTKSLSSGFALAVDEQEMAIDGNSSDSAAGRSDLDLPPSTSLDMRAEELDETKPREIPLTTLQGETQPKPAMSDMIDATTTLTSNLHRSSTDAAASVGTTLAASASLLLSQLEEQQVESALRQSSMSLTYKSSVMNPDCDDAPLIVPSLPHFTMHESIPGPVFATAIVVDETIASTALLPVQLIEVTIPGTPGVDGLLNDTCTTETISIPTAQRLGSDAKEPTSPSRLHKRLGLLLVALICVGGVVVTLTCTLGNCLPQKGAKLTSNNLPTPSPATIGAQSTDAPKATALALRTVNDDKIAAYINNISLTGRTIKPPWESTLSSSLLPEEMALHWLLKGDPLQLDTETAARRFRLQQRYALRTLWSQWDVDDPFFVGNECHWYGVTCADIDLGNGVGSHRL